MPLPLLPHRLIIKILEGEGFYPRKSRGTDRAYKRAGTAGSRTVIVPTHERDIARGTLRSIMRQAGWTEAELLDLVERYK
jgi:predicted RNA binding protein YcfA (HicA-like mRNA interferase family)